MTIQRDLRPAAVRLTDVAAAAGVSVGTASKALNNRFDVSELTRSKVLDAASELGFIPNALARGLLAGKSHTIGILTNDLQGRFVPQIMFGAEGEIGRGRSTVLLTNSVGDSERQQQQLQSLLERRVDGLIVVDEWMEGRDPVLGAGDTPVVYVFGRSNDPRDTSVVPDVRLGGRMAAEHLAGLGRSRIAHVGGEVGAYSADERAAGFLEGLATGHVAVDRATVMRGLYSETWGWTATDHILEANHGVDAIFAGNDQIARGVIDRLLAAGRRIPEDVAVVGYDNWEVLSRFGRLPITTIDMRLDQVGATAVELLYGDDRRPRTTFVAPKLIVRESTVRSSAP